MSKKSLDQTANLHHPPAPNPQPLPLLHTTPPLVPCAIAQHKPNSQITLHWLYADIVTFRTSSKFIRKDLEVIYYAIKM